MQFHFPQNYRQENEKLQHELQALEENTGKENMHLLENIESLKKEVDDKNQVNIVQFIA